MAQRSESSAFPEPLDIDPALTGEPNTHIDFTRPCIARAYDWLLGGNDNFAVDREAAERACAVLPGGIDRAKRNVRANREFLVKIVRYLAGEVGVRQFLDIGTGIPNADNVHGVAQQTAPDSVIVYVDYDPVVLAHAHELLASTPEGHTEFLQADLRDPDRILEVAADTLDLTRPVVLLLVGILHYLADDEAYPIVTQLVDTLPAGSWLVVSHLASDIHPEEMAEFEERANSSNMRETSYFRTHDQIARFFDGLELIPPGLARLDEWVPAEPDTPIWAAVGVKS